jgi:hypothetical protein
MSLKMFGSSTLAVWLVMIAHPLAAIGAGWDSLIQATYFSAACRQEAEGLGIARTPDANALLAAFLARRGAASSRADRPDARHDDCNELVVLLINLLRLNGIDAEITFVSMTSTKTAADGVPADKIDRVLVYVPVVDRYVDPAAPAGKQAVVDQIIRESGQRMHLLGPSLASDAGGACADTCLRVYTPGAYSSVRVRTEVVRGR